MPNSPSPSPTALHNAKTNDDPLSRTLAPRPVEHLHRIKGDLRLGVPVVLQEAHEQTLIALVESLTEDRFRAIMSLGSPELVLTRRRAEAIGIEWPSGGEVLRLPVPPTADLAWLKALAGNGAQDDVQDAVRGVQRHIGTGTQRAAIKLAKLIEAVPALLSAPYRGDPKTAELMTIPLAALSSALEAAPSQTRVSSAPLPMAVSQAGRVHVFRPDDGGVEHYAIEVGNPDFSDTVTVRMHSACFTGDVLGSLKCDCGPQLNAAMHSMAGGGGVLLYLNQEGRGIGLANKMRTYVLQDDGLDTVEANHWLGFEDDQRDFRIGAKMLESLGIQRIRLMTNNPKKVSKLSDQGIAIVERLPLCVGGTAQNASYLTTKAVKSGHLL